MALVVLEGIYIVMIVIYISIYICETSYDIIISLNDLCNKVDEFTEPVDPVQKAKFMKFKSRTAAAVDSVKKFMQSNYPPSWKYTDFAPQFTAEMFEPEKWAQIFNASGAK